MEIIDVADKENVLRFVVDSNEDTLFSLLRSYLESNSQVDIVGVYREHHLINKTEFFLKVKKGSAKELFVKELEKIKKDLQSKKIK